MTKKEYPAAEKDNIRFPENIKEKYFLIVEIVRKLVTKGIFSIARLKFELNHGDKEYFLTEVIDAKIRSLQLDGKPKTASMYEELKKSIGYLYEGKVKGASCCNDVILESLAIELKSTISNFKNGRLAIPNLRCTE